VVNSSNFNELDNLEDSKNESSPQKKKKENPAFFHPKKKKNPAF
jgi:hypothetical protein